MIGGLRSPISKILINKVMDACEKRPIDMEHNIMNIELSAKRERELAIFMDGTTDKVNC